MSFAELRDARLDPLTDAVVAWTRLVKRLESAQDGYRNTVLKPLRDSNWQGKAAQAAFGVLVPFEEWIRVSATETSAVASVVHSGHAKFKAAQDKLRQAIHTAEGLYIKVGEDGSLRLPPIPVQERNDPGARAQQARVMEQAKEINGQFQQAIREATQADTEISQALAKMDAGVLDRPNSTVDAARDAKMATQLAGFDANNIPPKGVDTPQEVARWWKSLPEEQRHLMMNAYPEKIGWLNGLPAEDRDEANRTRLTNRLTELQNKTHRTDAEERDLRRLQTLDQKFGQLEGSGKDAYLLGLDSTSTHDGRAIVAIGNPDQARHTAVLVPGTTTDLGNFTSTIDRTERLWGVSTKLGQGPVSTIAWLGYDAPDEIPDATNVSYAEKGASALDGFVDGLRQSQADGGVRNGHVTTVGHSYGSTLVGEAARHGGLHVNDIVVAGSPGMRVTEASDLHVGAQHVWSEAGHKDLVPDGGRPFLGGMPKDAGHFDPLVSRVVPSDPAFDGNRMVTDTNDHGQYWDLKPDRSPTESLRNQARVITGQYRQVTLEGGRPPA